MFRFHRSQALTFLTAIFSILQIVSSVPELGSQVLTVTAIFLPLSSMWASAALGDTPSLAPSTAGSSRRLFGNSFPQASARLFSKRNSPLSLLAGFTTTKISKVAGDTMRSSNTIAEDEMESGDMAIHVTRSFEVTTEKDMV